jgi:hypothetical protein
MFLQRLTLRRPEYGIFDTFFAIHHKSSSDWRRDWNDVPHRATVDHKNVT